MSPNLWPATAPFDPESEIVPAALEALWSHDQAQGDALVLVVGAGAQRDGWAVKAAIALATAWADRGGRLVLADLALTEPALHVELGEANTDGVADIFQFGASVRRMARVVPGRGFRYLPAGAYIPDPAAILRSPGWDHIIAQFSEDQATLLAYLPAASEGGEDLIRRLGRAIVLADPEEVPALEASLAGACTVEAVLSPFSPSTTEIAVPEESAATGQSAAPAESAAPEESAAPAESAAAEIVAAKGPHEARPLFEEAPLTEPPPLPRRPRRSRRGVSLPLQVVLLVAITLGGWIFLDAQVLLPEWIPAPPNWLQLPGQAARQSAVGAASGAAAAAPGHGGAEPGTAPTAPPEPVALPIPYSVAVEAHQDLTTAVERVGLLRRSEPGISFYLTPIPNQGVVYYRLLAGPAADTAAAWELMRRLVASRHKTDLDPWSIRPTVWAYNLGDFTTEAAAAARAAELLELRIPTYVIPVDYTSGPPRYRLFAGAYEGPAPAGVMAEQLREAGIDAQLVRREGRPAQ
jgi:hypothetical protein